jgi:hypothetical protein
VIPGARDPGQLTFDVRADEPGRARRVAPRSHGHANATKRDYARRLLTSATTRDPAWVGPLLTIVRRGSTVRVRQRALQKPRTPVLSVSDRFADHRTWGRYGALYGAFRSKTPVEERDRRSF